MLIKHQLCLRTHGRVLISTVFIEWRREWWSSSGSAPVFHPTLQCCRYAAVLPEELCFGEQKGWLKKKVEHQRKPRPINESFDIPLFAIEWRNHSCSENNWYQPWIGLLFCALIFLCHQILDPRGFWLNSLFLSPFLLFFFSSPLLLCPFSCSSPHLVFLAS